MTHYDTIPNPLTDKGVQDDIREQVRYLMKKPCDPKDICRTIEHYIKSAAEWGYSEGFRMGWRIREARK